MTKLISRLAMIAALALPCAAHGGPIGPPSPVTAIVPCGIALVGWDGGQADPNGNFTITIKDSAGKPIPNAPIVVDFTGCCNDIRLAGTQHNPSSPLALDPTGKKVLATTNELGAVTMSIMGMAAELRPAPTSARGAGVNNGCADIYTDGRLLTPNHVQVATYDEDGATGGLGVTGADFSVFLEDWLPNVYYQRGDFNYAVTCSQMPGITGADFVVFLGVWLGAGASPQNVAPTATCP